MTVPDPYQVGKSTQQPKLLHAACCWLLAFGLGGCVAIPQDQSVLPQLDVARMQLAADIKLAQEGWPQAQWWTRYGDAQLNALISKALTDSPTLAAAAARINAAEAVLTVNQGAQDFNTALNAGVNSQRYSANGLLPPPIGGSYVSEENLKLQARYDVDWWGKHKAQIAAAVGDANVRRAEYAQAEQTLAAAIAQHYFNLQNLWARLANLEQMAAQQNALVADKSKRIASGLATSDDQRKLEAQLSELKLQSAKLTAQTVQEREALRALTAAGNENFPVLQPRAMPALTAAIPTRLGIELLAHRPDLQAARWRVEASLSRVDVAAAAFYPDFNLIGAVGLDTISIGDLLEAPSRTFLAGASLSVPLFDSRMLTGGISVARSERNAVIADYNQSVLNSVREVAQAGADIQGIEAQLQLQREVLQTANALLGSAQRKFNQGLAARAATVEAELAVLQKTDAQLQLQHQQVLAEIALMKALGGGYHADLDASSKVVVQVSNTREQK